MENYGYLLAAYSIIFAAIFLYVIFIWRRQSRIDAAVRKLEVQLDEMRDALATRAAPETRPAAL